MRWRVDRYFGGRDGEVVDLVLSIQNGEAGIDLTMADQPDLIDIKVSYANGGFWIATVDEAVVGTIGLLRYGDRGALKKFFVAKAYRGQSGPASGLFNTLLAFAKAEQLADLFLDTPSIATRSHAFYRKAGFEIVDRDTLPADYGFPDKASLIFQRPV